MRRMRFAALGALASAFGLLAAAGGTVAGQLPTLASVASPAAQPHLAAAVASPQKVPQLVTAGFKPPACPSNSQYEDPADSAVVKNTPWAQTALGGFSKVWQLTRGAGQLVAVVDSGVNWTKQLDGRVIAIDETGSGIEDCVGHGTAVSGIIAAEDESANGNPFAGVAPQARILSVKVTNVAQSSDTNTLQGTTLTLADGIIDAVNLGASVINISIQTGPAADVAAAVQFAESHNVVVVAASGNDLQPNSGPEITGPFYPASYPGVLSVGALDPDGSLAQFSDLSSNTSVTAPGTEITSTEPGGYIIPTSQAAGLAGTSFAAPYVSGLAALIRARFPALTAAQVVARIEATADGNAGPGTGDGMINPMQAVQAVMGVAANPNPTMAAPRPMTVSRVAPPDQSTINAAMVTTAGSVGGAVLVAIAAVVFSAARRRRRALTAHTPAGQVPPDGGFNEGPLW
jgi:membrane-anchored mycosin MYCP